MAVRNASRGRVATAVVVVLLVSALPGCAAAGRGSGSPKPPPVIGVSPASGRTERVATSHCPVGLRGCRSAEGRIVYVEAHDPDGDGDAHFVILDSQGITLPGLTAIKVTAGLRPQPLPGLGDLISAAGPLQAGAHGETEMHALEVHVASR